MEDNLKVLLSLTKFHSYIFYVYIFYSNNVNVASSEKRSTSVASKSINQLIKLGAAQPQLV
jgi:hypothetical protein